VQPAQEEIHLQEGREADHDPVWVHESFGGGGNRSVSCCDGKLIVWRLQ
jgi:hypothetical protein